jgi:pyrroloquinoline quinone biosynthesis protein D
MERVGGRLLIASQDDRLHYFAFEDDAPSEVGERIVELADGKRTVREIAQALTEEYEIDLETAVADTAAFVLQLIEKQVLIGSSEIRPGGGLPSRERPRDS